MQFRTFVHVTLNLEFFGIVLGSSVGATTDDYSNIQIQRTFCTLLLVASAWIIVIGWCYDARLFKHTNTKNLLYAASGHSVQVKSFVSS